MSDSKDLIMVRAETRPDGDVPKVAFRTAVERIGGQCDLVKMDCEGAEWEMLADKEAWKNVDHISMEYHLWHGDHRFEDVALALADVGFRVRSICRDRDFGVVCASRGS
jgi:hypothetical protein